MLQKKYDFFYYLIFIVFSKFVFSMIAGPSGFAALAYTEGPTKYSIVAQKAIADFREKDPGTTSSGRYLF